HRAAHEVRTRHQPQDREGARPHHPAVAAAAGGSGDRSMRTAVHVNAVSAIDELLPYRKGSRCPDSKRPPAIHSRMKAHDVSIRSSTTDAGDRRGWASQSVSRSWQTINHPENARTGTSAVGSGQRSRRPSHGGDRYARSAAQLATTAKLVVVDVVAEHDVETNEELASERDFRLGTPTAIEHGKVPAAEIVVRARGQRRRLSEDPPEEGIALLRDLAEMLLVRRRVDRGRQADVTHKVLAVGETLDRAEDENRREGGQRADPGVREQQGGSRIGSSGRSDLSIEIVDPGGQPHEQIEVVVATARGVTGKDEAFEGGASTLRPQLGAERQAMAEGNGLKAVRDHGSHPDQADAVGDERTEITSGGVWNPDGRETIVSEKLEQMASVAAIGLRLADHHRTNLRRLSDEDRVA